MIIDKIFRRKNNNNHLEKLLEQVSEIRKTHDTLAIAPDNTGYNWLGIKNGAIALFPNQIICLPQYFSNSLLNEFQQKIVIEAICQLNFKKIVFRGFPPYFENIIKNIKIKRKDIKIYILFGGFLSEFTNNISARDSFLKIIQLTKERYVEKIGFNKNGLSETVEQLYGVPTQQYYNKTIVSISKQRDITNALKIGVLGNNDFRKNIITQVAGGLLLENSTIYVKNKIDVSFLDTSNHRIKEYSKVLEHKDYLELIHSMKINMYVSFSESWGHVIMESLAGGVPCIAADNSSIFESNSFLKQHLIVDRIDDSYSMYKKLESVLKNYEDICEQGQKHIIDINLLADNLMVRFLEN